MKKIKFASYDAAANLMVDAIKLGFVKTWSMTKSGYARYLCAVSGYWFDVNEATLKAWSIRSAV